MSTHTQPQSFEQRFQKLLEAAPDAMIVVDRSGRITLVNAQTEHLFGYGRADLLEKPIEILIPERFRNHHPTLRAHYAEAPRRRPMGQAFSNPSSLASASPPPPLFALRKDGTEFPVEISLSPSEDGEGSTILAIRDITLRLRSEQRLQQAKIAAEAAIKELEAFSYSVAHDLRAPLRSMRGFSEILLETQSATLSPKGQDYLKRIVAASDRMSQIIDALLRLSRLSRAELHLTHVDLSALCETILAQLRQSHPDRGAEIFVQPHIAVIADAALLRAALENLLENAWKFTREKKPARIEFTVLEQNGEILYVVRDNGAGFDMAQAQKLFTPFQRLHAASEFPGTGIGLATVHRIIQRHGGRIWAESANGAGAAFFFTLPQRSTETETLAQPPSFVENPSKSAQKSQEDIS